MKPASATWFWKEGDLQRGTQQPCHPSSLENPKL